MQFQKGTRLTWEFLIKTQTVLNENRVRDEGKMYQKRNAFKTTCLSSSSPCKGPPKNGNSVCVLQTL